jgi:ABC-type Mn2+/Zn2+ transport system ATPase subunit
MSAPVEPLARAEAVSVGWRGRAVLRDVTFELRAGEALALVGPNGSGKSTLLVALLGLRRPLAGSVVRSPRWRAGYVPQQAALDPLFRFSVADVVAMGSLAGRWLPGAHARERLAVAARALDAVGLAHKATEIFRDLSGGQRQRVLLARALARDPTVLVLDEPTIGLDIRAESVFLDLVRRLRSERNLAVVVVSHSLAVAASEADTIGLVHAGRVRFGSWQEILDPVVLASVYGPDLDVSEHLPDLSGRRRTVQR